MHALQLETRDPTFNLALEECLLAGLRPGDPDLFLLWRNDPSVIVGRHQNTVAEINTDFVRDKGVPVVRRISGGGAVYHDPGNLNFSFLIPLRPGFPEPGFGEFLRPVAEVLTGLGASVSLSGRNDLITPQGKCSGSARFRSSAGVLLHGTLLIGADLDNLAAALTADPEKFRSKGLASVRARVTNLAPQMGFTSSDSGTERAVEVAANALLHRFRTAALPLTPELVTAAEHLAQRKYRSWEWNYGRSPFFTERRVRRFPWGRVECLLEVHQGTIRACRIYGDFFAGEDPSGLEEALLGCLARPDMLGARLRTLPLESWFTGCNPAELAAFLSGEEG